MKTLLATLALVSISTFAFAEAPAFTVADANADGLLSMEEAKVALPDMDEEKIAAADVNQDGSLSESEYSTLIAS